MEQVLLDRIRGTAGMGLQDRGLTLGEHRDTTEAFQKKAQKSLALFSSETTCDL